MVRQEGVGVSQGTGMGSVVRLDLAVMITGTAPDI